MKSYSNLIAVAISAIILSACGGGGGSDSTPPASGSSGSNTTPVAAGPQAIALSGLSIGTNDVLTTTQPSTKVSVLVLDSLKSFFNRTGDMVISSAYASTNCGVLCQPAYPPANMPAQQQLTARLASGGALASISPVFTTANASAVKCDFTNVGVKVNSIWWLDVKSQNALVNLSVPTSIDSGCNLTYTTGDYVVFGATGKAVALNQDVIGDISDMIPAGDQGFNSSTNTIYLSKSTGLVRELQIDQTGNVARVDLTTSAQATCSKAGSFGGQVVYDGTYLVGNAVEFSGLVIYQKGSTAIKTIRDTNTAFNTPCTTSVVINDQKQLIAFQNNSAYIVNPTNATSTVWDKYVQNPQALMKFTGRSGSIIGGDRCNYWDYAKSQETSIYATPVTWNLPYAGDVIQVINQLSVAPKYSRVSEGFAYCVTAQMNNFVRQDLSSGNVVKVNLDSLGYLVSSFTVYSDRAFATVTNKNNSNVEYIEIDFITGAASYRGIISAGGREVINLVKASNG